MARRDRMDRRHGRMTIQQSCIVMQALATACVAELQLVGRTSSVAQSSRSLDTNRTETRPMPNAIPADAAAQAAAGAHDRPARSSLRGRGLGRGADRRRADRDALARRARAALDRRQRRLRPALLDLRRRLAAHRSGAPALGKVEPEHEYPPRFAQVLGSVALILALVAFALGATTLGWVFALAVAGAADAPRGDRLLPGLPAVLPALVGAGPRDPDLDPRPGPPPQLRRRRDPVPLTRPSARTSGRRYGPVEITSPSASKGRSPLDVDPVAVVDHRRAGRDHRADRAVLRRRQLDRAADRRLGQAACRRPRASTSISVKTCGYSSRWCR